MCTTCLFVIVSPVTLSLYLTELEGTLVSEGTIARGGDSRTPSASVGVKDP